MNGVALTTRSGYRGCPRRCTHSSTGMPLLAQTSISAVLAGRGTFISAASGQFCLPLVLLQSPGISLVSIPDDVGFLLRSLQQDAAQPSPTKPAHNPALAHFRRRAPRPQVASVDTGATLPFSDPRANLIDEAPLPVSLGLSPSRKLANTVLKPQKSISRSSSLSEL